jgi:ATP-dependent DNA helicase RecQ
LQAILSQAAQAASDIFGYQGLRTYQSQVLSEVLSGRDCIAILPTGSGKSLCYGLPASLRSGLVLVISPLIALMRDQVRRFREVGISCDWLDSHRSPVEKDAVMDRVIGGHTKILLVSPERLAREDFRERLRQLTIQLVAVDEAHCISQWGGHFRPDYRLLGQYLAPLGPTQKIALTATATDQVRRDISQILNLQQPALVTGPLIRTNLKTKIVASKNIDGQFQALLASLSSETGTGMIYTPTRKLAEEVYRTLVAGGKNCAVYHAGLTPAIRQRTQEEFLSGKLKIVVATNAFGLGVDKADIRFVHHMGLPGSLEQYVQEIGRAGRDGKESRCYLFYNSRDYHVQKFMIEKSYPELSHLKTSIDLIRRHQGPFGLSEVRALELLRGSTGLSDRDTLQIMDILYRESLLSRMRPTSYLSSTGENSSVIFEGSAQEAQVFRTYPERKRFDLAKLETMKAYVQADEKARIKIIDEYFDLKSS